MPANGSGAAPTGNVQFYVDNVATGPVVPVGGATLTTTGLARGDHTIRATYVPVSDPNYNSASGTRDHDVGFVTTVSLSRTSPNGSGSVAAGTSVTLRARVSNSNVGGGYPTPAGGTVTFLNGTSVIGTATVVSSSGNYDAVLTTNQLPTGSNNVTARLEPNNAYNQAISNTYNQVVRFSVSPSTVNRSPSGTRTITITGVGFVATPSISIDRGNCGGPFTDGISGEAVTSMTPTQLTVQFTISSSASRCSRDITVNNNGSSVTVEDAITIN